MADVAPKPNVRPSFEVVMEEIMKKIAPAVASMYENRDSGEIAIRFQAGDFRQAVRREVIL